MALRQWRGQLLADHANRDNRCRRNRRITPDRDKKCLNTGTHNPQNMGDRGQDASTRHKNRANRIEPLLEFFAKSAVTFEHIDKDPRDRADHDNVDIEF